MNRVYVVFLFIFFSVSGICQDGHFGSGIFVLRLPSDIFTGVSEEYNWTEHTLEGNMGVGIGRTFFQQRMNPIISIQYRYHPAYAVLGKVSFHIGVRQYAHFLRYQKVQSAWNNEVGTLLTSGIEGTGKWSWRASIGVGPQWTLRSGSTDETNSNYWNFGFAYALGLVYRF